MGLVWNLTAINESVELRHDVVKDVHVGHILTSCNDSLARDNSKKLYITYILYLND